MKQTIGSFEITTIYGLFDFDFDHPSKMYSKNGVPWGTSSANGTFLIGHINHRAPLTRAQGFKYWEKHFKDKYIFELPKELQKAIELEPTSHGCYMDRNGHLVGYSG